MEKRQIYIIAIVLIVSIGIRVIRAKMGKNKGGKTESDSPKEGKTTSESSDDYEPYSNK